LKLLGWMSCALAVAAIVAAGLPARALAEGWSPTPLPSIAGSTATGYPGHPGGVPGDWPAYDTDKYPDSESCQLALNHALKKVSDEIYNIPPSTTPEQFAYAKEADAAIKANGAALAALRPICLHKPPPNAPIEVEPTSDQTRRIETLDPRYAPLKLLCPGYSECTVVGKYFIDCVSGNCPTRRSIAKGSFSLRSAAQRELRVHLTSAAQKLLKQRGSLNVRLTVRTTGADGHGPAHTLRKTMRIQLKKR
jgi:hypothetical protein